MTREEIHAKKNFEERLHEAEDLWRKANNADTLLRAISMAVTAREQFTRQQLRLWLKELGKKEGGRRAA
jgi:hypothetical protein